MYTILIDTILYRKRICSNWIIISTQKSVYKDIKKAKKKKKNYRSKTFA